VTGCRCLCAFFVPFTKAPKPHHPPQRILIEQSKVPTGDLTDNQRLVDKKKIQATRKAAARATLQADTRAVWLEFSRKASVSVNALVTCYDLLWVNHDCSQGESIKIKSSSFRF
jgi:hypothetical protein